MPAADELAKYEAILPGTAERLLKGHERHIALAVDQAHHRFFLENSVVAHNNKRSYLGLAAGVVVVLGGFFLAYKFALLHYQLLAGGTFFTDLSGLAGLFIYGTNSQRKERMERQNALLVEQAQHQK